MAHVHPVYDTDKSLSIDVNTKSVKMDKMNTPAIAQYDHNSEYITFECDRFVEGHDLSLCDKVEVHYINREIAGRHSSRGVYEANDLQINSADKSKVVFSWLISERATTYAGILSFVVSFSCNDEGDLTYRWNTNVCNELTVGESYDYGEAVVEAYADVLEMWKLDLFGVGETEEARLMQATRRLMEELDAKGVEVVDSIPDDYTGLDNKVNGVLDIVDSRTVLDETYIEDVTDTFSLIPSYLHNSGSIIENDSGIVTADAIECSTDDIYYITASSTSATACIVTYDENRLFLRAYGHPNDLVNGSTLIEYKFVPLTDEKLVRFGSFDVNYAGNPELIIKREYDMTVRKKVEKTVAEVKTYISSNWLYGKKYVACGDSYTEGDFTGYVDQNGFSGKNSPEIYDSERGMYKTYPWWIAERNGMTLVNEAKCGSVFTNITGANNPFSVSRYKEIPTDADYITLMFGLNEVGLTNEQIGTKNDTTNSTLWGAYNIVFEYFLTNIPYAKIGVIIPDSWMNDSYSNALKDICTYWGIPYLDMKNDPSIPMGIYGRLSDTSPKARELRNKSFMVSDSNAHPNVKAHEYRSTFIEAFIRSL